MKVRLAFAVAAHLDLEILLVDEVLAVGDAEFQRKCLGRMSDVARSGRTVLFVSHSMPAVQGLCQRAVLLEKGAIIQDGDCRDVVNRYLQGFDLEGATRDVTHVVRERQGNGAVRLQRVEIRSAFGENVSAIAMGEDLVVRMELKAHQPVNQVFVSLTVSDASNQTLFQVDGQQSQDWSIALKADQSEAIECQIPGLNLAPGRYSVNIWVHRVLGRQILDFLPRVVNFDVLPADLFGTGQLPKGNYLFVQPSSWALVVPASGVGG
jgi:lipopolysaccharide transport system ATP-binding protein